DRRLLPTELLGLRRNDLQLLLEAFEQEGGELVVFHSLRPALAIEDREVGERLRHLLGDQPVLDRLGAIGEGLPVAERDGAEARKHVGHRAHRLDVLLVPTRGDGDAKLAVRVYDNRAAGDADPADAADKGRGLKLRADL